MLRRVIAMLGLMLSLGTVTVAVGAATSGCYVAAGPGHCPGGYWIEGHYDRWHRWHPGHWRCPGVVEVE